MLPRSGTPLMLEMMATGFRFPAVSRTGVSLLEIPEHLPEDGSLLTRNPQDHRLVTALIDRDENQWFISLVRDPRDVICSRHGLHPEVYWANLRQWREWLNNTRPFRNHPRLVEVHYEALVKDPDQIQQQISRRMPFLAPVGHFSDYHRVANPSRQSLYALGDVRPVSRDSVGRWRRKLPSLAGQLSIHGPICRELVELGYEKDGRWLAELSAVEPDTRPGHWPEFLSPEFVEKYRNKQQRKLRAYLQARGL